MADFFILLLLHVTMLVLSFVLGRVLRRHDKLCHLLPVVVMGKAGREKSLKKMAAMTKLDQNQKNGLNPHYNNIDHVHLIHVASGTASIQPATIQDLLKNLFHLSKNLLRQNRPPRAANTTPLSPLPHPRIKRDFTIDREKRNQMNDLFIALQRLIPNPNKLCDRASIAGDAIVYIQELLRLVRELEFIVSNKRFTRGRKRINVPSDDWGNIIEISSDVTNTDPPDRTSWIQRKSRVTEVDVLIIDDKVTIKLVHRKKMVNFLLYVSRVLDELQLDLHHVSGCRNREHHSYFSFNSKIKEGSSVYASTIASKIMETVDAMGHHQVGNLIN